MFSRHLHSAFAFLSLLMLLACDSRYTPRTVPDSIPPVITVRLTGEQLNRTYRIQGMDITPIPPDLTPTIIPGKRYRASIVAADTIGL